MNDKLKVCSINGCEKRHCARGFCKVHYQKAKKNGDISIKSIANSKPKHGMHLSVEYTTWSNMKARCNNKNHTSYKTYGAKGISVCDRWNNSFDAFLKDMGLRPDDDHSIDRIDPLGEYSKDNCRWVTWDYQCGNKIKNKKYTYNGMTMTGLEWITFLAKQTKANSI